MLLDLLPYFRVCWWARKRPSNRHDVMAVRNDGAEVLLVTCLKVYHPENAEVWIERQPGFITLHSCERLTVVPAKSIRVTCCTDRHQELVSRRRMIGSSATSTTSTP